MYAVAAQRCDRRGSSHPGGLAGRAHRWHLHRARRVRGILQRPGHGALPGLVHIAAQALFAVLSTRGGRVGEAGAAGLVVVGAGATAGALGEKITYRVFSSRTFDPVKAAIVSAGITLSLLMTVLGARRLLVLRGRR